MRRSLAFEPLEPRQMLAVFTVTSLADAPVNGPNHAPGTLRQAIFDANAAAGADTIQFQANLSGTINLSSVGDTAVGSSALRISSNITIRGNSGGITIQRGAETPEMRLFRVTSAGTLTLETITVTGGVVRSPDDQDALGGAIHNQGTLRILSSTLHGNQAIGGNAVVETDSGRGLGGAIYNAGGTVLLENATLSGNIAQSGTGPFVSSSLGGGIYSLGGNLSIYNSTITNSTAASGRGVTIVSTGAPLTLTIFSSIIAQSDLPSFAADLLVDLQDGEDIVVTGANNLIRRQSLYNEIAISTDDPQLDPLAANGGPTLTHALTASSPALHAGTNPRNLTTDQRGSAFVRVVGDHPDIGAFELQTATVPDLAGDYNDDNFVNAADYVVWRKTFGNSVELFAGADGSGNGIVDAPDYEVWRRNFGLAGIGAGTIAPGSASDDMSKYSAAFDQRSIELSSSWQRELPGDARIGRVPSPPISLLDPHPARDEALLAVLAGLEREAATDESIPTRDEPQPPAPINSLDDRALLDALRDGLIP